MIIKKPAHKHRPAPFPVLHGDFAPVGADNLGGNGQSQAKMLCFASGLLGSGFVRAVESPENFFFLFIGYADARIFNPDLKNPVPGGFSGRSAYGCPLLPVSVYRPPDGTCAYIRIGLSPKTVSVSRQAYSCRRTGRRGSRPAACAAHGRRRRSGP